MPHSYAIKPAVWGLDLQCRHLLHIAGNLLLNPGIPMCGRYTELCKTEEELSHLPVRAASIKQERKITGHYIGISYIRSPNKKRKKFYPYLY